MFGFRNSRADWVKIRFNWVVFCQLSPFIVLHLKLSPPIILFYFYKALYNLLGKVSVGVFSYLLENES